jgi:hypothetical protein
MQARIDPREFMPYAEKLRVGGSVRAKHCNHNTTMIVSRHDNRVTAHCFRCGERGWQVEQENLEDKLRRIAAARKVESEACSSLSLPEPRVYDLREWPRDAALWLYKSGFSPSMIRRLGAYWCPDMGRVVLPVMEDGHAVFWQARAIARKPKIISPKRRRDGLVAKYGQGDTVVLCEDMLSAFKVGQVTEAWSLLGTVLLPHPMSELLYRGCRVIVWLDSDTPGQTAANKITKTLRAHGVDVRNVVTEHDPKKYDRTFIKEKLCLST